MLSCKGHAGFVKRFEVLSSPANFCIPPFERPGNHMPEDGAAHGHKR